MMISFSQEGSKHDRGLYARCYEELFDLSNSDTTSTSRFNFSVSVFELYHEQVSVLHKYFIFFLPLAGLLLDSIPFILQIRDLLLESGNSHPKIRVGSSDFLVELVQEQVENPIDFIRVLKVAFQKRGTDELKFNVSHLYGPASCFVLYFVDLVLLFFQISVSFHGAHIPTLILTAFLQKQTLRKHDSI